MHCFFSLLTVMGLVFASWAASAPDAPACLILNDVVPAGAGSRRIRRLSYRDVWDQSVRLATVISDRISRQPQQRTDDAPRTIGLMVTEGQHILSLHLAILMARPGGALVPLDRADPRLHLILDDARPSLVIALDDADADLVRNACPVPTLAITLPALLDLATKVSNPTPPPPGAYASTDISHIYFTSGSTGRPKGCVSTLGALLSYCTALAASHSRGPGTIALLASPHTFDPTLGDLASAFATGGCVAVAPRSAIFSDLERCLAESGATHVLTTPALLGTVDPSSPGLTALRVVALGGEAMGEELVRKWHDARPDVRLLNTYGVTECCVYQTAGEVRGSERERRKNIGVAIGENRVVIMAPATKGDREGKVTEVVAEDMREVAPGEVGADGAPVIGELWIAGPQVGVGYLNRPDLTARRFLTLASLGWCFRTGDLASYAATGEGMLYLGREDSQVKVRGQRVETEEVEQALVRSLGAGLVRAASVVMHNETGILVAFMRVSEEVAECVPVHREEKYAGGKTDDDGAAAREVVVDLFRMVIEEHLPKHMVPSRFILVDQLPLGPTGKIARNALAEQILPEVSDVRGDLDDHGGWSTVVGSHWRSVLGLSSETKLGSRSRFEELGGDSLKALAVCKAISADAERLLARSAPEAKVAIDDSDEDDAGVKKKGEFGELMGALAPAELLKRPRLGGYAAYLKESLGALSADPAEATSTKPLRQPTPEDSEVGKEDPQSLRSTLLLAAGMGLTPVVTFLISNRGLAVDGRLKAGLTSSVLSKNGTRAFGPTPATPTTTPLHVACLNGRRSTATALMSLGASVSAPDAGKATPLHLASQHGPLGLLDDLLAALGAGSTAVGSSKKKAGARTGAGGGPLLQADANGQMPLHHAARSGAPDGVVARLVAVASEAVGRRDKWGRTPLHWAVVNGHRNAVKILMDSGADAMAVDGDGETALQIAERRARYLALFNSLLLPQNEEPG
ncbi:hypothetical protein HK101_006755 [Irineochytrium annulatum]|nr:hypothetical protein HK101_006755 [Irineochytrium annulatum]